MRRLLVFALLAVGTPAIAQQAAAPATTPPRPGQPTASIVAEPVAMTIAAFDADGDAIVTHAEMAAGVQHSFDAADADRKGALGYIGYSDWALQWLGDRNALPSPFTVDTDGDNRITLAELEAQFDVLFARFDIDKDGSVTRAELLTIRSGLSPLDFGKRKRRRR